jgi:hypothetical protein
MKNKYGSTAAAKLLLHVRAACHFHKMTERKE